MKKEEEPMFIGLLKRLLNHDELEKLFKKVHEGKPVNSSGRLWERVVEEKVPFVEAVVTEKDEISGELISKETINLYLPVLIEPGDTLFAHLTRCGGVKVLSSDEREFPDRFVKETDKGPFITQVSFIVSGKKPYPIEKIQVEGPIIDVADIKDIKMFHLGLGKKGRPLIRLILKPKKVS